MSDIRDKARGDRNWVERILHHVPGFRGYLGKEERRETDKLMREQLSARLERIADRLDPAMHDLARSGGLAVLGDLDRLKKNIKRLADKVRYASYGYSGMFDVVKIREAELDRLYAFDAGLLDRSSLLENAVDQVRSEAADPDGLKPLIDQALNVTRELEEQLDRRTELITEYPKES